MAKSWKCAHCATVNPETTLTCSACGRIQGSVVVPPNAQGAPGAPPGSTPVAGWPADAEALARMTPPAPPLPWWRRIPITWIVGIGIALAISFGGLIFAATRDSSGQITKSGDLTATELRVGDCFDLKDPESDEVTDVTARPCNEEHEYELFFTEPMADGPYPSKDDFTQFVVDSCGPAFDTFVGRTYEDSVLDIYWMYPLEDVWSSGDHDVQCAVFHPRVHRLTSSLKDSKK